MKKLLETGVNMESETTLDSTSEPAEEDEDIRDQDEISLGGTIKR